MRPCATSLPRQRGDDPRFFDVRSTTRTFLPRSRGTDLSLRPRTTCVSGSSPLAGNRPQGGCAGSDGPGSIPSRGAYSTPNAIAVLHGNRAWFLPSLLPRFVLRVPRPYPAHPLSHLEARNCTQERADAISDDIRAPGSARRRRVRERHHHEAAAEARRSRRKGARPYPSGDASPSDRPHDGITATA